MTPSWDRAPCEAAHDQFPVPPERLFRSLVDSSPNGIIYTDHNGRCLYANERAAKLLGRKAIDLEDFGWVECLNAEDLDAFRPFVTEADAGRPTEGVVEHRVNRPIGGPIWVATRLAPVRDSGDDTAVLGWLAHIEDITERRRHESELDQLARRDPLTDLHNRFSLDEKLRTMLDELGPSERLAVAVIDLDRFKLINDTFGHDVGDQLLADVARKLGRIASPEDVVARLGGDEFAFVSYLDAMQQPSDLGALIARQLRGPVDCGGRILHIVGSVGVASTGPDGLGPDDLLRNADTAMYRAKRSSTRQWQIFDESIRDEIANRFTIESDVRTAVEQRQFRLAFQPIVDARDNALVALEALARFDHPERGSVSPERFITVAEEIGVIRELGEQLLDDACAHFRSWRRASPHLDGLILSVNTSPLQLADPGFSSTVFRTLARHGLPARNLLLEITEQALIRDIETSRHNVDALRAMGVAVALDDFGTGYSSLSYLDQISLDYIKIDQHFIQSLGEGVEHRSSNRLTQTIIDLSQKFDTTPIAEGIETELQRHIVLEAGCDLGQGYFFGQPMEVGDPTLVTLLGL